MVWTRALREWVRASGAIREALVRDAIAAAMRVFALAM